MEAGRGQFAHLALSLRLLRTPGTLCAMTVCIFPLMGFVHHPLLLLARMYPWQRQVRSRLRAGERDLKGSRAPLLWFARSPPRF